MQTGLNRPAHLSWFLLNLLSSLESGADFWFCNSQWEKTCNLVCLSLNEGGCFLADKNMTAHVLRCAAPDSGLRQTKHWGSLQQCLCVLWGGQQMAVFLWTTDSAELKTPLHCFADSLVVLHLGLQGASQQEGSRFRSWLGSFCVEFACSTCTCMGIFQVL